MKLKENFTNSNNLSKFLDYAQNRGIRQFHVCDEYSSYNLLVKSLQKINTKKFTFILKLCEPRTDKLKFSFKKFKKKIFKYQKDLGKKHNYIIQFVNRHKCNFPKEHLLSQKKIFDNIQIPIANLKKNKIIKSFYFFPYHTNTNEIKQYKFIDGITSYRNIYERQNDNYAKINNYKIIAMRTFGGEKKIVTKKNLKKLITFNSNNKLVKKIIVGINSKKQLDQLLEIC